MAVNQVVAQANWAAIRALAPARFDTFRRPTDTDDLDGIARYAWNMALCRAAHTPLHILEVTFRNQVHNALSASMGRSDWFNDHTLLSLDEQTMVIKAKRSLDRLKRPHDPGRVIAELSFGFWTGLYGAAHEQNVIRPTIHQVFPNLANPNRSLVSPNLRNARQLRNRVSHHEPICFDSTLPQTYQQIIVAVKWMSAQMADVIALEDGFARIYGGTWQSFRGVVETVFGRN